MRLILVLIATFLIERELWVIHMPGSWWHERWNLQTVEQVVAAFAALLSLDIIVVWLRSRPSIVNLFPDRQGFKRAPLGVPHVGFKRTAQMFGVTIRKRSLKGERFARRAFIFFVLAAGLVYLIRGHMTVGVYFLLVLGMALIYLGIQRKPIRISVRHDKVVVNGKSLRKEHFGGFYGGSPLGYVYGNQCYDLGGHLAPLKAPEIVLALNLLMHSSNQDSQEHIRAAATLRESRPTDF